MSLSVIDSFRWRRSYTDKEIWHFPCFVDTHVACARRRSAETYKHRHTYKQIYIDIHVYTGCCWRKAVPPVNCFLLWCNCQSLRHSLYVCLLGVYLGNWQLPEKLKGFF